MNVWLGKYLPSTAVIKLVCVRADHAAVMQHPHAHKLPVQAPPANEDTLNIYKKRQKIKTRMTVTQIVTWRAVRRGRPRRFTVDCEHTTAGSSIEEVASREGVA